MRCQICDYSETSGSEITGQPPNPDVTVRHREKLGGVYCSVCYTEILTNISDLTTEDDEDEH